METTGKPRSASVTIQLLPCVPWVWPDDGRVRGAWILDGQHYTWQKGKRAWLPKLRGGVTPQSGVRGTPMPVHA